MRLSAAAVPGRRHRPARLALASLALAGVLAAAGCGSAPAAAGTPALEKPDITVGVVASESSAGVYVAQNQGLFARAGLHVTLKTITGAAAVLPALLHGGVDVAGAQLTTFIQAQAQGVARFRILAPGGSLGPGEESIVVLPHSPITTPARLKGATVAVNAAGGINQILAQTTLRDYGIQPGQVHYVGIPFQDMGAALAARRVSAAYLAEPYLTEAEQRQGAIALLDPDTGPAQNLPISAYVTTRTWADKYPHTAAAFARAVEEADALIPADPAAFRTAMQNQLHLPPGVADVMATGSFPTGLDTVQLQRVADLLHEFGVLTRPFSVKAMIG
jgi:NitT/TauT family transport system substrate-binding protein